MKVSISKSDSLHYIKELGMTPKGAPVRVGTKLREMNEYEIKKRTLNLLSVELGLCEIEARYQNLTFKMLKNFFIDKGLTVNEEQFLNNIPGIYTKSGEFSMMAELLSDKNNTRVLVVIFQGRTKSAFARRNVFGGKCLIDTYYKVLDHCQSVINDTTIIKHDDRYSKVGRVEFKRFDNKAFEEAWLNAITYNDWLTENPPIICVFDDRIEITSSGGLPTGQTIEGFYAGKSVNRCKQLFDLFDRLGLGEHTGHGVQMILEKYDNDKSIFEIAENYITVTFKYPDEVTRENERTRNNSNYDANIVEEYNLSSVATKVLELIKVDERIKAIEIALKLNKGKRTIDRALAELQMSRVIERIGSRKDGYWKIII